MMQDDALVSSTAQTGPHPMLMNGAIPCPSAPAGSQHDPVDFDALDNSRFGWERKLHSAWEASPFAKAWAAVRGTAARPAASAAAKRK